jgi:hypothetical protein
MIVMISIVSKDGTLPLAVIIPKVAGVPVILVVYPVEGIEISLIVFYVFWCGDSFYIRYKKGQFVGLNYCKPTADFARLFQLIPPRHSSKNLFFGFHLIDCQVRLPH